MREVILIKWCDEAGTCQSSKYGGKNCYMGVIRMVSGGHA